MSKSDRGIGERKDGNRTTGIQEIKKNKQGKDLKEVLVLKGVIGDKIYACPSSLTSNKVKQDQFVFTWTTSSSYKKSQSLVPVHLKDTEQSKLWFQVRWIKRNPSHSEL